MKLNLSSASIRKWITGLAVGSIVLGLSAALPSGTALADGSTPTPRTRDYSDLTKAFQADQKLLGDQQNGLDKAGGEVAKVQDLISKAQAKGVDVSTLQAALSAYQSQLSAAQGSHAAAASTLSAHNGFNGSGNVTDPAAARQTVQDAGQSLKAAHDTLSQAVRDLGSAVKNWREANLDKLQNQDLQKAFQDEQKWFAVQTDNLTKAGNAATDVQDLINKAQAKGLDASALQSALVRLPGAGEHGAGLARHRRRHPFLARRFRRQRERHRPDRGRSDGQRLSPVDSERARHVDPGVERFSTAVKAWEEANKDKLQDQDLQKAYQDEHKALTEQQGNLGARPPKSSPAFRP